MTSIDIKPISGGATDVLWCLFLHGPTWDGNIPSKTGRAELVSGGYALHHDGLAYLTEEGVKLAMAAGMHDRKESVERKRRAVSDRQHRAYCALMVGLRHFVEHNRPDAEDWMAPFSDRFDLAVRDYVLPKEQSDV